MWSVTAKKILFHSACITLRLAITTLIYLFPKKEAAAWPLLVAVGFAWQTIHGNATGAFGSTVYWPRPIHMLTHLIAAVLLLVSSTAKYAFLSLLADTILGIIVFWYHYRSLPNALRPTLAPFL